MEYHVRGDEIGPESAIILRKTSIVCLRQICAPLNSAIRTKNGY